MCTLDGGIQKCILAVSALGLVVLGATIGPVVAAQHSEVRATALQDQVQAAGSQQAAMLHEIRQASGILSTTPNSSDFLGATGGVRAQVAEQPQPGVEQLRPDVGEVAVPDAERRERGRLRGDDHHTRSERPRPTRAPAQQRRGGGEQREGRRRHEAHFDESVRRDLFREDSITYIEKGAEGGGSGDVPATLGIGSMKTEA